MTTKLNAQDTVDNMIDHLEGEILIVNSIISDAVATLSQRAGDVDLKVAGGLGVFEPGLIEAAAKVERYVVQRQAAYEKLHALEVIKAKFVDA